MPTSNHKIITRSLNVLQRLVIKSLPWNDNGQGVPGQKSPTRLTVLGVVMGCKGEWLALLAGLVFIGLPVQAQTLSPQAPASVTQATIQDLSRRLKIPSQNIRVQKTQAQTWPNGCLGLGKPDELCTQALVPGWQVVLEQGKKRWTYRTNQTGSQLRVEFSPPTKSP